MNFNTNQKEAAHWQLEKVINDKEQQQVATRTAYCFLTTVAVAAAAATADKAQCLPICK